MTKPPPSAAVRVEGEGSSSTPVAADRPRCRWCRRLLPVSARTGRRREFCRQACRQWDWVARQRARELAISDDELVVTRHELDTLRDDLYVLTCTVADVRRDLEAPGNRTARELLDSINWLLDAAVPLCDRELASPSKQHGFVSS